MDIGGELRTARLARSRSIDDISRATKIAPSLLRAIENNAFDDVPGGLFTRGFLRAYAREVGLDPEDVVQRYRSAYEPSVAVDATRLPAQPPALASMAADETSGGSTAANILQVCVMVVIAVGYLASLRPSAPATPVPSEKTEANAPPAAAAAVPVSTTGTTGARAAPLTIELQPHGRCWVDATADGSRVIARLMSAGDRRTLTVNDALTLRLGDPAAFAFSIDGAPGRVLGREGVPVTVRIDRGNYESFLDAARRRVPATSVRRRETDAVPAAACCPRIP